MPWVQFDDVWDERQTPRSVRSHAAGSSVMLTRQAADDAVNAGKAHRIKRPEGVKAGKDGNAETEE